MKIKIFANIFLLSVLVSQALFLSVIPQHVFAQDALEVSTSEEIPQSHLIISAVQITGGTGKTQEDFIELFNPTTTPFDLNGYRLVKRTAMGTTDSVIKAWSEETIVQARHFYLWANSGFTALSIASDADSSATLADNNGIALRYGENDVGEILDSLTWGSTANGFIDNSLENPGANESLIKANLFEDSSNFNTQPSSPRNSSVELLPAQTEDQSEETPTEDDSETETGTETPTEEPSEEETTDETIEEDTEEAVTEAGSGPSVNITITEILPNPSGSDAGFEQIELYNSSNTVIRLAGYKLDDIGPNQVLSSNAYSLPDLEIGAESYLSIVIPAGSMSLNNTGGDIVSLFGPTGELVSSIFYEESALEGKSYSYFPGGWQWTEASFGQGNILPIAEDKENDVAEQNDEDDKADTKQNYDNSGLEITEIFPQPDSSSSEFIEIYNFGPKTAQLSMVALYIGDRKKLLPDFELQTGQYFVMEQNELPIQLRNSGQVVKLQEGLNVLSTVTYPIAITNQSFAKFEDGFLWTSQITKSADNILKIPEEVKKELSNVAPQASVKKTSPTSIKSVSKSAKASTAKTTASKNTEQSTAPKEAEIDQANSSVDEAPKKQKESFGKIIAMGAAAVIGGVVALYKLVLSVSAE